jgi:hypothetical protein
MYSWMRRKMAARAAARLAQERAAQRLALALVRQVQAAATLRQLALVQALAAALPSLPARLRRVVAAATAQRLLELPPPVWPSPQASPRSSSSRTRPAKSTTRPRR